MAGINLLADPNFAPAAQGMPSVPMGSPSNLLTDQNFSPANAAASPSLGTIGNFALGGLQSIRNFAQDVADLPPSLAPSLFPRGQLPQVPQAQGFAGAAGRFAGNVAPFVAGGAALEGARALAAGSDIPGIAQGASWLGQSGIEPLLARQAAGGGIYGAITNPDNRLGGAVSGSLISTALAGLPFAGPLVGQMSKYFKPQDMADQITDQLSNGGQSLEQSGKNLASTIKNVYDQKTGEIGNEMNQIRSQVGDQSIYPSYSMWRTNNKFGQFQKLPNAIPDSFSGEAKDLNSAFSTNPTFNNANELQKSIGSEIGSLKFIKNNSGLDKEQADQLVAYGKAYQALRSDMNNYLDTTNPDLSAQWNNASDRWRDEVVPFHVESGINDMAKGNLTNPTIQDITGSFKNPEPQIQQVVNSLPDNARNSILYAKLGTTAAQRSPEALSNAFKALDQQGLNSYVPDSLRSSVNSLNSRMAASKFLGAATGGVLGLGLSKRLPIPGEALMAGGAYVGNKVLPKLINSPLFGGASSMMGRLGIPFYPTISNAIRANFIPGAQ